MIDQITAWDAAMVRHRTDAELLRLVKVEAELDALRAALAALVEDWTEALDTGRKGTLLLDPDDRQMLGFCRDELAKLPGVTLPEDK
jgi:hypothetical protein